MKVSVIVTSYNQESTLRLLLASLERQSSRNFEVVIADDGSSDQTALLCTTYSGSRNSISLKFVSQEDKGYRKAKILNEAIRNSEGDYLIFLDADVILEKHFIEDHLNLKKLRHFVCGRRVDLGPDFSKKVTLHDIQSGKFDHWNIDLILSRFKGDTLSLKRGLRVTPAFLRQVLGYDRPLDILGSNFSAWKADILSVNGFNEALESYWGEDGDIYIRLRNSGLKAIGAKSMCIQYHVFHERRVPTQENRDMYFELLKNTDYKWAQKGII